jgi:hypothetical protein
LKKKKEKSGHFEKTMMDRLFAYFKRKFAPVIDGPFWELKTALICTLYCVLISMPNYTNFNRSRLEKSNSYPVLIDNYTMLTHQIDHPFQHHAAAENTHASKLDFRFVPALLARAIPSRDMLSRMLGLYIINNIAGFIFFMCILRLVFRYSGNRLFSALAALNFAVLYVGKSFFHDTLLWNDGIAFMFLALALLNRNAFLAGACLLLAFFTDERALFGGILAFVYCRLHDRNPNGGRKDLFYKAAPFLSAYILYLVIRGLLKYVAGMGIPLGAHSGVSLFLRFHPGFPAWLSFAGTLLAYKSAWVIIALSLWWMRNRKSDFLIYLFGLISVLVISVSVQDLTRSLAYAFITILIGFFLFYQKFSPEQREKMEYKVFTIFIINLCIPTMQITYIRDFKIFPPVYKMIWPELHTL